MALTEFFTDLWAWWAWEAKVARRFAADPGAAAVLRLGRASLRVQRADGSEVALLADAAEAGAEIKALIAARRLERGPVEIVIEADRHLQRRLSRLRLPRSRMRAMARLDLEAASMFGADECVVILPVYDEERPESVYFVLRRGHLDPLLASLAGAGIAIGRIGLRTGSGHVAIADRESVAALLRPRMVERLRRDLPRAAALTAIVALAALPAAAHWRYSATLAAIDEEIAAGEQAAAEVRRAMAERERGIAEVAAARLAKSEAVPLIRVLEELARALPDGTWLADLDFGAESLTFSGTSAAAADLIPALDASPLFHAPTFSQPVTRTPGDGLERFTITLEMEPAHG